jgi:trimeric autotransporter adhesin
MIKFYAAVHLRTIMLGIVCATIFGTSFAQTTLTTLPATTFGGNNSLTGPAQVTFVLRNNNPFPVLLTGIGNWCTAAENNSVWQLYATTTALSGASTDVTIAPWTLVGTSTATAVAATGIAPINFPGLSYNIAAGAQVRFALRNTGPGSCRYSGTGAVLTPNTFSGGGVDLLLGDVQIAAAAVGYSGSGTGLTITPRYFNGFVTFQPALPCTNPPIPGTVVSSANPVCFGQNFNLTIVGGTGGTGQSYQWQSSPDNVTYTNISGATNASLSTTQAVSTWYRCVITCGASVNTAGLQVVSPTLVSGTYTINSALPTGGTNFNSFNAAYNYIKCGISGPVIFNVDAASGPYNEQLIMTAVPGASAVNTVTFNGNGRTLQFNSTNTNERGIIKLNGAKHITFDNLNITALGTLTTEFGFGVHLLNDADSNTVRNCSININTTSTSTNYAGIAMSASAISATTTGNTLCDFNTFSNNIITGGYYGITLVGSTTVAVGRNRVIKNQIREPYNYGIYMLGNFNTLVDSNTISRPTRTTVTTLFSIFATSLNTKLNITRNTITNPFGGAPTSTSIFYGIYFTAVDALPTLENLVINNTVNNLNGAGDQYGIYNTTSDNVWYYHNTLSMDGPGTGSTATNLTRGFFQTTLAAGIEFKNNLVTITRGGISNKHAIYFATNTSNIVSNYNNFYLNAPAGTNNTGFFSANQATLANWQTAATQDANSIAVAPLYAGAGSGNMSPTNASMDSRGTPLGITTDILGAARSATTPDIGAWEFAPGPCVAPPTAGVSTVNPSTVCAGDLVTLDLTGNSIGLGQTYQWQSSPTIGGTYTNIGAAQTLPTFNTIATLSQFYRCMVICSNNAQFSEPVFLIVNPALAGGTYTINKTAPASATNFISFNAAKAAMNCGIAGPVIFNVVSGTGPYNEQLILDTIRGVSAINTITFNGNGNTIAFSSSDGNERAVIKLRQADYTTFDSLRIDATGAGTFGVGVQLVNNADNNTFRRCNIITVKNNTSTNYAGIIVNAIDAGTTTSGATNCDNNTFERNMVTGGYYGITLVAAAASQMFNNRVLGNTFMDYYSYGTYILGSSKTRIDGNDYSRPTNTNVTTHYAVYVTTSALADTISNNKIHDPFKGNATTTSAFYAVFFTAADGTAAEPNRVYNNIVYNVTGEGDQYGFYNSSSDYALYYHNTLDFDDKTSVHTTTWWTRGIHQVTSPVGMEIKDNIITIGRTGFGTRHAIYLASGTAGITLDYNDYFVTGGGTGGGLPAIGFNGTSQATLANWQASTAQEANTKNFNPIYTSASTGILIPLFSPLDNIGTPVGITSDIRGLVRSATTPDMGAFEYAIVPCTNPPTPGTASVIPNVGICLGTRVDLNVTGNSTGGGQYYIWQNATSASGPWANLSDTLFLPAYSTFVSNSNFFRCQIICNNGTPVFSTITNVTLNPPLAPGVYTINNTLPTGGINYNSFNAAVTALECGIAGHVYFDAAPGTYTEQVRMKPIGGSGDNARVTFRSANGNPASVTLTFNATLAAANYTLKLDSASYVTYKNITIANTNTAIGRVVDIAGTTSKDSILTCIINAPVSTTATQAIVGIHADLLTGSQNVIKGNTINNGAASIYFEGTSATNQTSNNTIDSNFVSGSYQYGIYAGFNERVRVTRNTVTRSGAGAASAYGIYANSCDTGYVFTGNIVNMGNNTTGTVYGMFMTDCDASLAERGLVAGNKITATTGNTASMYGMNITTADNGNFRNNVISVNTTGTLSYGLFSTSGFRNDYFNNTVHSTATSASTNIAAHFSHTSATTGGIDIRNNIFSHAGNGRALSIANPFFVYSDYNMLYTTGPTLVVWGANNFATLQRWRDTSFWDINSIAFQPAFTSNTDLTPNIADPNVWGIHGRGVQIAGNNFDFNNNPRPTTLTTGVPDLGAYEFLPTAIPFDLPATPPAPAPGITQTFMLGTDTVTKITWNPGSGVPSTIKVKRYSGVLPTGLSAGQNPMYFYTDIDTTGTAALNFNVQQFYIDPWQGFISQQNRIRLGRTQASGSWLVGPNSATDTSINVISENNLAFIDKFTGLEGPSIGQPPVVVVPPDSSNRGTKFWVPYGHHQFFGTDNSQQMVLYLSAEQAARVTVRINGTPFVRTFDIPANTAITTPIIPKTGLYDARIIAEGLSQRGISIESDTPIVAYAHIYGSAASGASLLLPVGTYGYEYFATGFRQNYAANTYAWFNLISDRDSTKIEITPANPTLAGRPANVPFTITLMKGEVYQVLGAINSGSNGFDLTGSRVKSVPNNAGNCYPFAMFSGSSRTAIYCSGQNTAGNGDNIIQQNFPSQAWGKKYLTAPTSNSSAANSLHTNIFRVVVRDAATVVRRNGTVLTGIVNNRFYEFDSNTADYIDADQPVMVSQYMASSGSNCANSAGNGDPEMFYLSPIEQAIKRVVLFRNTQQNITLNYLTLIIPTAGVTSLTIDGSNTFDYTYVHPNLAGYTVVVKRWTAAQAQARVQSDSAFTAITYGEGSVESYGYNAGTLVKNLNAITSISNVFGSGAVPYTCAKTPFRFFMYVTVKPTVIEWKFSQVPNLTPNADVVQNNPTPLDSIFVNGRWLYRYTVAQDYTFSTPGTYYVPIFITHPTIEACNSRQEITLKVDVKPAAISDFSVTFSGCLGDVAQFNGSYTSPAGSSPSQWQWNFGDATTATIQNPTKTYGAAGTYNVSLRAIGADGCIGDTVKPVIVNPRPVVNVVPDTLTVCLNGNATWTVQNPVQGATYNWYTAPTGGTLVGTGTSFTAINVTTTAVYYVEGVVNGCASVIRKRVTVGVLPLLTPPVVVVDSVGVNAIKYRWNPVPNATSYEVSTNNGTTWQTPSSGPTGTTHTVIGLVPLQTVTLIVKALGGCRDTISVPVSARTLTDQIYIPNAFSPNGDGLNDVLKVYGYIIRDLRFTVFNQWGEKIFESRNQAVGWDGLFKGKPQPSGVYIYLCDLTLKDGTKMQKKGSINLVR